MGSLFIACAASKDSTSTWGSTSGGGGGGGGGSGTSLLDPNSGQPGDLQSNTTADGGMSDARASRPQHCDDAGHCKCLNIASLGYGGTTGSGAGTGGTDNTQAFVSYLNTQSSAQVAQIGCGTDLGCLSPNKPTLTDDFLKQYDVIIVQWLVTSVQPGAAKGTFDGAGYWTFTADELAAVKNWVNQGGGLIFLSGYDSLADELTPTNQLLSAVSSISYSSKDTYNITKSMPADQCLGYSDPVTTWAQAPDLLGQNVTEVGAFYGRTINPGKGTIDCSNPTFGVCAAHEDVGMGHVFVFADEWVTYTSQWYATGTSLPNCVTTTPGPGQYPAVQVVYQTPQFWYNAISYAAQATSCPFTLTGTTPIPR